MIFMTKTEQLEELFKRWQNKQKNEPDTSLLKTKVNCNYIDKEHFCKDGILCENEYNAEKMKVLFIANEPNMESDISNTLVTSQLEHFEYFFKNNKDNWGGKLRHRICKILYPAIVDMNLEVKAFPIVDGNKNTHRIAFMNLNKRGGEKDIQDDHLIYYCKYYQKEIYDEICIIDPDIVVWLGKDSFYSCSDIVFETVKSINDSCKIVRINHKNIPLLNTYHPSYCYHISNEIRINDIRNKYRTYLESKEVIENVSK